MDVYRLDANRSIWDRVFWNVVLGIILICHVTGGDPMWLQVAQFSAGCGDVAGLDESRYDEAEEKR